MLKVIHPSDAHTVDTLVGCLYSPPGLLKTTLAFTARDPLLLDFDHGVHRAEFRRAFVHVERWKDVADMNSADLEPYKTIIVDTAGRALDSLAGSIIDRNPKMGNVAGGLTLQGFGQLKSEFAAWLQRLRSFGKDILLVAHMTEEKRGDDTVERLDMQGASRQEVYKSADFMGRLAIERDGTITMNLSPSDTGFGKNPGNLPVQRFKTPIEPSSRHMEKIFEMTKARINAMTKEQQIVSEALEQWRDRVVAAADASALTALIAEVPTDERLQENAKRVLNSIANDKGFRYDKDAGRFVQKTVGTVAQFPGQPTTPVAAPQQPQDAGKPSVPISEPTTPAVAPGGQATTVQREREPGDDDDVEPPLEQQPNPTFEQNRKRLISLFFDKYKEPAKVSQAFRQADAKVFFKGKIRGTREGPAELSDMDVAIMLHAIDSNQLSI